MASPSAFHLWLRMPGEWTRGEFIARLRPADVGIVGSDAFAVSAPPEAVRIALGTARDRLGLRDALRLVADLLAEAPAMSSLVV